MEKKQAVDFVDGCDQGELHFVRVDRIPKDARLRSCDGDIVVVGHSASGHHHAFARDSGVALYETPNPLVCYLRLERPAMLDHHKELDDHHASILFSPGMYEVRKRREYVSSSEQRAVVD